MSDVKYDPERLKEDTEIAMSKFKSDMEKAMNECLGKVYVDVLPHIETDAWTNYREALRLELSHEYKYTRFREPWAKDLRRAIFVENREELSFLLNQDIIDRIKVLEDQVKEYEQFRYSI